MNVIVLIEGREAIPVRAIPLLTNWRFMSPDIVAHVLGGTGGSNVSLFGDMQSSYIESGKVQPIDKDWWIQFPVKELRALSEKIQIDESSHDVGYSDWRKHSLKELPAGVFVWKDEYQKLHDANWYNRFQMLYGGLRYLSKEEDDNESTEEFEARMLSDSPCKDLMRDEPLKRDLWSSLEVLKRWREPNYSPFMRSDLYAVVMDGFESQVIGNTHSAPAVTDGVEISKAGPLPLTTGDIAFCFAGLRWDEQQWKKPLGNKPKWLAVCIAIPGARGVSETRWNPVLIGAALEREGHAKQNSIRARFQTQPQLAPWLDAWKTHEADNFTTE